jgi:CHAT domain-containing protein
MHSISPFTRRLARPAMHHRPPRVRFRTLRPLCFGLLLVLSLMLCLGLGPSMASSREAPDPAQQVKLGIQRYQAGDYRGAMQQWQPALRVYQQTQQAKNAAIVLENLARAAQNLGQSEAALGYWQQAIALHRQAGQLTQLSRAQIEQAQVYSQIGQPRKAIALLCGASAPAPCTADSALQQIRRQPDPVLEAAALGSLGDAYRLLGDYAPALQVLELGLKQLDASLETQGAIAPIPYPIALLHSLGTVHLSLALVDYRRAALANQSGDRPEASQYQQLGAQQDARALGYLQRSGQLAQTHGDGVGQLRSQISAIPAYYRTGAIAQAEAAWHQSQSLLAQLPPSRERVYAAIDLARLLQPVRVDLAAQQCLTSAQSSQAEALLQPAIAMAEQIQDARAQSFALGELGRVYECQQAWAKALQVTQRARLAAEHDLASKDSLYLWEWQTGRLLKQLGQDSQAIAAYERALTTLEPIRSDILTSNRDLQFDFRDTIEPIYRELVELKLDRAQPVAMQTKALPTGSNNLAQFRSILRTVDGLKLAELQNYFGTDCVVAVANQDKIDLAARAQAAVFSTVIFEDRTAVILSLPNGTQRFTWIPIPRLALIDQINDLRRGLERVRSQYDPAPAQQVYDWLIRPFASELAQASVKTLVFVQDGILRTVPMAALHDGQQFLIQRYAIATVPSLTLTNPKPVNAQDLRVLALGLTKAVQFEDGSLFRALPNVGNELAGIQAILPGSKRLLDGEFTRDRLQQELSQTVYPILHVATHGKFATDPKDTFIVTGDNQKLTLNDLDDLIRRVSRNTEPLDLLSLTACETAVGNDRSALGLAGVAVQAGASSALASLWSVNDAATAQLATRFYQQLRQPNRSKAEALQRAQQEFIAGKNLAAEGAIADPTHPGYWAAFVLIGNWL